MNVPATVKTALVAILGAALGAMLGGLGAALVLAVLAGLGTWSYQHGLVPSPAEIRQRLAARRARRDPGPPAPAPASPPPAPRRPAPAPPPPPPPARQRAPGPSTAALARSGPAALMGTVLSTPPPPEWQALAAYVGGFEPENADDLIGFIRGNAAGVFMLAEALAAFGETCEVIRLDPLIVAAAYAITDVQADGADAWLAVAHRFLEAYAGILEDADAGRTLPVNADEFFGMAGRGPAGQAA